MPTFLPPTEMPPATVVFLASSAAVTESFFTLSSFVLVTVFPVFLPSMTLSVSFTPRLMATVPTAPAKDWLIFTSTPPATASALLRFVVARLTEATSDRTMVLPVR